MPTQHGVGLDDQQGRAPEARPAGEDDEEDAVERCQPWPGNVAVEDDELLPQECILRDEGWLTPHQIGRGREGESARRERGPTNEAPVERVEMDADA